MCMFCQCTVEHAEGVQVYHLTSEGLVDLEELTSRGDEKHGPNYTLHASKGIF